MAKKSQAGTDVQKVRQQNAQSSKGQYGTEFAAETDAQQVKKQNQQSETKKQKNS
ncbi:MAG: gamma-type small acid-soluble spore protein [Caldibacillus debilis]|jgi:small acid-soluble spore protein E (minor gamma-type SASP)|uniref:Small, acid-soluble spore protein gamma-type n=2 Tax=Caldibacillus debilis TaxID=301148 RepID=A0A420VCQ3_9BACI|nr:gamma-type small acid-soluble spore protein [Caldibacillus debilis]MBO2483226.1 gamma-type small acid-soluble spore protein [Bacillaceae bacterium]MBY6273132.1 gamma-type small acid-soluble spore protein [Bacillaceae bacterium]OUM91119.1 MAG: spore protein [Caldibacillus debilis]REJ14733.1 MAG: gamma-type small acid-soluble spore protein [Caldibacillus debilis]REJ23908.1 MAG: gamma-type small acid-soluble spore protein [Caldibacillus debilis]